MGIRPSMMTIFGIDNLKCSDGKIIDSRYTDKGMGTYKNGEYFNELPLPIPEKDKYDYLSLQDYENGKWEPKELADVLHWDAEFGESNVIGFITSMLPYDNDCIRALAMLDNKFMDSGYSVLPVESEQERKFRILYDGEHSLSNKIKSYHFYQQAFYKNVPDWIKCTKLIFDYIGLNVKESEMKWMLYWQWS